MSYSYFYEYFKPIFQAKFQYLVDPYCSTFARVFLQVTIVSQKFKLHYSMAIMGLTSILTCESNSLFAFRTLSRLPFKRLLDPGGKCMKMSDMQGSISRARRQHQTIMALMHQTIMALMSCSNTK